MSVKSRVVLGGVTLVTASLTTFVANWEGTEYVPYKDGGGVWTVCQGITGRHVIPNKVYTRAECEALTNGELERHGRGLMECIAVPIPQHRYEALASWTYNVGISAACGSTLVRRLNASEEQIPVCKELLRWNKDNGKVVRGLTNRRQAEYLLCIQP